MDKQTLATIILEGARVISGIMKTYTPREPSVYTLPELPDSPPPLDSEPDLTEAPEPEPPLVEHITTDDTIRYQRREIAKELILLEGHLQQGCKINGRACDCCEKHPIKIEGLAQETAGMTPEPIFSDLAAWVEEISPLTTESASASGQFDDQYPSLAIKAREFRKAIMTPDIVKEVVDEKEIPSGGEDPGPQVSP